MKLSAIIITKNEEKNIVSCFQTLKFCDEIIVVDSQSTDQTREVAKSFTSKIFIHPFKNFSDQKNFALSHATGEWVLSIDADERVSPLLREEIESLLKAPSQNAYRIPRRNIIFGQEMRYGANREDTPLRLFKRDLAYFEGLIHESVCVQDPIGNLKSPLIHMSTQTLKEYVRKLDQYTSLEAELLYAQRVPFRVMSLVFWGPARFVQRYFFQRAFQDGRIGFIFAVLSGFYEFIRWVKLWELHRQKHV